VSECDREASITRRPCPTSGCCTKEITDTEEVSCLMMSIVGVRQTSCKNGVLLSMPVVCPSVLSISATR
jgi:hypothetical protein